MVFNVQHVVAKIKIFVMVGVGVFVYFCSCYMQNQVLPFAGNLLKEVHCTYFSYVGKYRNTCSV
jgi:hypothetical protein